MLVLVLVPSLAAADPCASALVDPLPTPLREADAQRGACLRDELAAHAIAHALIDTPNFHGVLGGELGLAGRVVVGERLELGARARLVDYTFAQTAVNKVTATRFGPVVATAALGFGELAIVAALELPLTRDEEPATTTTHTSGQLGVAITTRLAARWMLHARLGGHAAYASSAGGSTSRFALRAGTDLARRLGARWAVHAGADLEAGWRDGFSTLLARAATVWRPSSIRIFLAAGVPLLGDEPTTVVITLGVARDF